MTRYKYLCEKCKEEFIEEQSIHDEPLKKCKKCKGKIHRVFSPVTTIWKI